MAWVVFLPRVFETVPEQQLLRLGYRSSAIWPLRNQPHRAFRAKEKPQHETHEFLGFVDGEPLADGLNFYGPNR
jgi:hypothetical protein